MGHYLFAQLIRNRFLNMKNQSLRVGVIGTGVMGERHCENLFNKITDAHLEAVSDLKVGRAERIGRLFGDAKVFETPKDLINSNDVDAVLVATSDDVHSSLILDCIKVNKPVLCEKPMSINLDEAWQIIESEITIGRKLVQIGFCRRYDDQHLEVKRKFDSGDFGRSIFYKGWHRNRSVDNRKLTNEQILLNSAIHEFDSIRWLLGEEARKIYVTGVHTNSDRVSDLLDLITVHVSLSGDCVANFDVYMSARYGYEIGFELIGQNGTATIGPPSHPFYRDNLKYTSTVESHWLGRLQQAYLSEVQSWVHSVKSDDFTGPTAWDGYMSLQSAIYGIKSLETGSPMNIPEIDVPDLYDL